MKIGIVTFQRTTNFGAIMQCYALNKKIRNLGAECETIDYHNKKLSQQKKINLIKKIYNKWKEFNCNKFINKMIKLSPKVDCNNVDRLKYDAYVVGSDQVWNINCTDDDLVYFLHFNDNSSKYTYAASFGLDDKKINNILLTHKEHINKFNYVSTREKLDRDSINLFDVPYRQDVDPVFLLSNKEWNSLSSKRLKKQKYIYYYTIGKTKFLDKFVEKIAKEKGLIIINNKKSLDCIIHCNPNNFISWIKNAEYIVTNSFHATAFSIIFRKNFYTECNSKEGFNHRIFNLLKKYNLTDRIVEDCNQFNSENTDYTYAEKKLPEDVEKSTEYLNKIINKEI